MFNFKSTLAFLSSCSGLLLFIAGCANFVLAYRACSVASVVQTNVVEVVSIVSNVVDGVSSVSNTSPASVVSPSSPSSVSPVPEVREPRQVAEYPYRYFLAGRRIGAQMFGRYYYDGSPCSYGRIDKIFPDRILLVGGDWIQNRFDSSPSVTFASNRSDLK